MASLEQTFEQACASGEIAGAVMIASNTDGSFRFENTFGKRSVREDGDQSPLKKDGIMWIASCTKLLGTIAALQCVERGQLSLDAPIYDIVPEFKDQDTLTGIDDNGKAVYQKGHSTPMTLRLLLTHSAGLGYDEMYPLLMAWRESRGEKVSPGGTIASRMTLPLLYDPSSMWMYGCGIDWAGKMVERVNDNMPLDAYMQKHIFEPLGITDMTFDLATRPDLAARMVDMSKRDEQTGKVRYTDSRMPYNGATEPMAGQGLFTSAPEYMKVLQSLLANDGKLLQPATVDSMFEPNLSPSAKHTLNAMLDGNPIFNNAMGGLSVGAERDWGLGGLLMMTDVPGWRSARTLTWGGLPNLTWWIDRKAGLCGIFAGQLIPTGDARVIELSRVFERDMYRRIEAEGGVAESPKL
ncbi:beta-lactamase/transpeptidase-like protein [Phyllosticta capitalensis]